MVNALKVKALIEKQRERIWFNGD